ncbi:Site-specific recombinase XerD [Pedococcus cremeus]|uniref:Site-specific recombinase XerD n=1 Tax=Pedococcus cremeus TaxID=587636 RepID=A0A1H9XHV7_9MICO|nr:site-specific integrase [Pedococcus cremeus]SES45776.1 Site-specific recombinase XerD [Pedococcus cremeus]
MAKVARDTRDGRWLARWRDPSGKQRKKSFSRRVDAERFLIELQAEMQRGRYIDPSAGKLLFSFYAERWLSGLGHLKATTAQRYGEVARTYVLVKWGNWPLASITRTDVAAWIGELHRRGLSAGTIRKAYLVASQILDAAVADGCLGLNPAKGVRLPRQVTREPHFMTADQVGNLADAAGAHRLAILTLALTGLRFGEFAALKVSRLEVDRSRLYVAEAVTVVGSQLVWSTPKSHARRHVPVPRSLLPHLVTACEGKSGEDLIFPSQTGGAIRLNNWRRRVFDRACADAGLVGFTPHDLRHTAASLAISVGANVKAVQRMLGHASAAMTLDIYAGLFADDLDQVGSRLDSLVPQMCHNDGRLPSVEGIGTVENAP